MQVRKESGITLLTLVITVVILGILTAVTVKEIGELMGKVHLETISTDLMLVQAKAKVIAEKVNFNDDESLLKGQQINEITNNEKLNTLLALGVINESEEHFDDYYMWNQETINELDIGITDLEESEFFIVNYETEEVIYSEGYEYTDGVTYYKLSEISELE